MRKIKFMNKNLQPTDNVEIFYEKRITPFGNSVKVDAPKYISIKELMQSF